MTAASHPSTLAPHELTGAAAVRAITEGTLTAEELVRSCLERIGERESTIGAWAHLDADAAIARARELDRDTVRGPLHGIPIGVKDVIDTADMPTAYGAPYYAGWQPVADASCVALLKHAGAIILGKTTTPEFACGRICDTANPWNPQHTAGGSSAGSCAAVADLMVPMALGTQSAGSLIRPASYNGVIGFKPTFGMVSVAGWKYFNGSFDTIGLISRTVEDVALLWRVLLGLEPEVLNPLGRPPRIGVCRSPWIAPIGEASQHVVTSAAERMAAGGAEVVEITLPVECDNLVEIHLQIQAFEAARSYAHEYFSRPELNPNVRRLIEAGFAVPFAEYQRLLLAAAAARNAMARAFKGFDALIAPSASSEAPNGHHDLGDSAVNRPWTLLAGPCINLPGYLGPTGLPIGFQLSGAWGDDWHLLSVAQWVAEALAVGS
ncbi:MAG TPA: amidase [Bauldia sp.]|nr:amidase [Bauldia sp.]